MNDCQLVEKAIEARKHAYAPYSKFHVGAALLCANGRVFTGCNVENAAYGVACCAERVALYKAVSEGEQEFDALAIASSGNDYTFPCGICRQALIEFSPQMRVLVANQNGDFRTYSPEQLLPNAFSAKDLKEKNDD